MKQIAFLFVVLITVSPSFAQDGPFGISMGDLPEQHGCVLYENENLYECRKIAKSHPDIEDYMVFSSEETGIVMIRTSGYIQENDVYGSAIMELIDKIANQLTGKYGEWTNHIDYIADNSIWTRPNEWAGGVADQDRVYGYNWTLSGKESNMVDIYIVAKASISNSGTEIATYFMLELHFSNKERFMEIINNEGADAF